MLLYCVVLCGVVSFCSVLLWSGVVRFGLLCVVVCCVVSLWFGVVPFVFVCVVLWYVVLRWYGVARRVVLVCSVVC